MSVKIFELTLDAKIFGLIKSNKPNKTNKRKSKERKKEINKKSITASSDKINKVKSNFTQLTFLCFFTFSFIFQLIHLLNVKYIINMNMILIYENGYMYEGTGQYGQSEVRLVDYKQNKVLQSQKLDKSIFGEGITILCNKIFQLSLLND